MAQRPKGTYVSNVFNPGFDKNLPFGFVDVVYTRDGDAIGFMKGGNFYKLGEEADDAKPKRQRVSTDGLPGINDQRSAQSERDTLSSKLEKLDKDGVDKNSPEYVKTYNDYLAAQKRLDDINSKIEAYVEKNKEYREDWEAAKEKQKQGAYKEIQDIVTEKENVQNAKEAARTEKRRKELEAEKADAERRGDKEAARKAQSDINNLPKTKVTSPATTPTESPIRSGRAEEAGVNKVTTTPPASTDTPTGDVSGTGNDKTGSTKTKEKKKTAKQIAEEESGRKLTAEMLLNEYRFVDAIIEQDPTLKKAYLDFVKGKITEARFKNVVITSDYVAKNSAIIRQRTYNKAVYNELGPEDQAAGNSQYAQDIFDVRSKLQKEAQAAGAVLTEAEIERVADRLYMAGQDDNENARNAAIRPFIKVGISPTTGGATVGGAGGTNYRELLQTAYQNGISVSELPKVLGYQGMDQVLQAINAGEPITTFQQNMRSYVSAGQSDFVKNQLAQGVDLRTVAQPYITAMAEVLELQPDAIKLNDTVLQAGLQNNGMNIFDYKKLLKKDNRWQYTKNAEQEVSSATMRILRDFGFEA